MTYTHKLARRLSLVRIAPVLALAAGVACAGGDGQDSLGPADATPNRVVVTPQTATIAVNQKIQLAAYGRSASGDSVPVEVQWSASGGVIDPDGAFLSSVPGMYRVIGWNRKPGIKADTTTIEVVTDPAKVKPAPSNSPDSADASPAAGAASNTAFYPNMPSGLTRVCENSFDGLPGQGHGTDFVRAGGGWRYSGPNLTTAVDASAPQSAGKVARVGWMRGLKDGMYNHGEFNCDFDRSYKQLYVSWRVKIPSSDYENQLSPGVKLLGYLSYGNTDRQNQFFLQMLSTSSSRAVQSGPWKFRSDFTEEYAPSGSWNPAQDYFDNQGAGPQFRPGEWQQVELYFKLNDNGRENGVYKLWINGVLVQSYDKVTMINSSKGARMGFYRLHFDPIWGGNIGQVKQRSDFLLIDHLYVAGIAQ